MELLGIQLVGFTAENGQKLLATMLLVLCAVLVRWLLVAAVRWALRPMHERSAFWLQQSISLAVAVLLTIGILSIWFDDPTRLTTAMGLVTAGLAFALQKVITALAGYFVILRGNTFSVGDRITMGGVRGDVMRLGFIQTTIMEMGQPPSVQSADPAIWVRSRQFTGRIVTVTNDKIFDEPIYNYTNEFPYIWEEIPVPLSYRDDRRLAERILLEVTERHTASVMQDARAALNDLQRRFFLQKADIPPRVFYRLTDNWLELTVRFMTLAHGIRAVKDAISRDVLDAFEREGIGIASATYEVVGLPPLRFESPKSQDKTETARHAELPFDVRR